MTLQVTPRTFRSVREIGAAMPRLIAAGLTNLPMGNTLERWRALGSVGALDLSLAKIYEGHTDALAILTELGGRKAEGLWAVWAAEPSECSRRPAHGTKGRRGVHPPYDQTWESFIILPLPQVHGKGTLLNPNGAGYTVDADGLQNRQTWNYRPSPFPSWV